MTVALGLVVDGAVIVASDSMASSSDQTARPARKVNALGSLPIVWAGSGSLYVIEEVAHALAHEDAKSNARIATTSRQPDLHALRTELARLVGERQSHCYGNGKFIGHVVGPHNHPFSTDFLLLGFAKGEPWFIEVAGDGQVNWHTGARFASIGSGGPFATVSSALMSHYLEGPMLTIEQGLRFAYRAIETTCNVSSGLVGLPVQLAMATPDKAEILDDAQVDAVREAVARWKELERNTLAMLIGGNTAEDEHLTEEPPVLIEGGED